MYGAAFGLFLLTASFLTDCALLVSGISDKDAYERQRTERMNPVCDEIPS
jgi:hypothetical protein